MNTTEKKILSPELYPRNKDIQREWFIKYRQEDFTNGGFKYGKYKGLLNLISDPEQRIKQAEEYIAMMLRGEDLPSYQGQKSISTNSRHRSDNTNVIECCKKYLRNRELEGLRKSTITDYRSKIKIFGEWLTAQGKQNLAIGAIDKETAGEFLLSLKARGLGNTSYNDYRAILAQIWDEYKERIRKNPWRDIKPLRSTVQHLKSYPDALREHIRKTLPAYDPQMWLFMQCVYYCGIRPQSELRFLKVKHLNLAKGIFTVPSEVSKNHKTRHLNIFHKLIKQFRKEEYHTYPGEFYLFGKGGEPAVKPASKNHFARRWSDYRTANNIDACYKLYGSKHTGGKKLTKKTNAYITKEHFDHADMKTTQNYIDDLDKNELKDLQKIYPEF